MEQLNHKKEEVGHETDEQAQLICRAILLTIFFTTPTLGGLVKLWLRCLGLHKENTYHICLTNRDRRVSVKTGDAYESFLRGSIIGTEVAVDRHYRAMSRCWYIWHYVNDMYLKPLFGKREKRRQMGNSLFGSVRMTVLQSVVEPHLSPRPPTRAHREETNKESVTDNSGVIVNSSVKPTS